MNRDRPGPTKGDPLSAQETPMVEDSEGLLNANIGASIDRLVEYLVQNDMQGVHPLIMGEIEKRLLTRTLELCNGNKGKAAKILGISRNTFHRKIQRLYEREKTEPG